jgi:hypothetical protein
MLEGIDCQARLDGETIVIEPQPGDGDSWAPIVLP